MIFRSYINFWKCTFDFSGRSVRSDFWVPFLTHIFIFLFVFYFSAVIQIPLARYVILLTIVPSFAVTARRLHDTNRTLLFAVLFPISAVAAPYGLVAGFIGIFAWHGTDGDTTVGIVLVISILCLVFGTIIFIYSLILFVLPGDKEPNKYGSGGSCLTSNSNE